MNHSSSNANSANSPLEGHDSPLVQVDNLKTHFSLGENPFKPTRFLKAVDGVSFDICRGQTLGLVGESGSGKTTVGRTIIRLIPATSGRVIFGGTPIFDLNARQLRKIRKRFQYIFQDPQSSLNPRMTVESIISEPFKVHTKLSRSDRKLQVAQLLTQAGLSPEIMKRYPHEFSGGQRQRIGIARALACKPEFIICDEPVSALDVSIQAQILNLLSELQASLKLTYLFIAHNLAVVEHFSDRVAVMYLGKIVELGSKDAIFNQPKHPYTQSLLDSVPVADPNVKIKRSNLKGEPPSPISPPTGCAFHPRCPIAKPDCGQINPAMRQIGTDHKVRCPYAD